MGRNRSIHEDDILHAARSLFLERGRAATTREIARLIGISESVLYQRYGSKNALFHAAIAPPAAAADYVLRAITVLGQARTTNEVRIALRGLAFELLELFARLAPAVVLVLAHQSRPEAARDQWQRTFPIRDLRHAIADGLRAAGDRRLIAVRDALATTDLLIAAAWGASHDELLEGEPIDPFLGAGTHGRAGVIVAQLWWGIAPGRTRQA